ncbi:uncharacterized protein B0P05DRAFT_528853, partial [Gilbertella persicaria]|uniref:uncharacterized protein n=1 Tax=Gilbertella persicaria TaxID=101096 RepID=UPI00222060CC
MNNTENRSIELSIKSLEQQIKSVSLPRNASVLELKSRIQVVFHVDSLRQRLIFQGKVLKDDKNLLDYENLDDGKVVHLVVRPLNAPIHPEDDEPRMTTNRRRHDGYTVITLSETRTPLLNRFTPSVPIQNSPFSPPDRSAFSSRPSIFQTLNSHRFDSRRTRAQENRNNIPAFPIPSSLDMRLSRTLAYIREIRTLLQTPLDETEIHRHQHNPRPTSLPAIQESRELLAQQPNQSAQVGLILNELAALFSLLSPYLREVSQTLTRDESTVSKKRTK